MSTSHDGGFERFSYREFQDIAHQTKSYEGVIASADLGAVGFSAEPGAMPRVKSGMMVSGNYFRVLGVEPRLGRGFRESEDEAPGRDAVTVLGPEFWKHEFGSDPSVVGRTIRLNGRDFTVIGVAPEAFSGMQLFVHPDFYMPLAMVPLFSANPQKNFFEERDDRELNVEARLKRGTTLDEARHELAAVARNFERDYTQLNRNRGAAVHTQFEMRTRNDDGPWKFIVIFAVLALAVLLVACTNVAGLLLSRARARTREIAVRLAMGAGRFRLIRLLLTESLMLACLGGLGGIALAYGGIGILGNFRIPSELPVKVPFQMDTARVDGCTRVVPAERGVLRAGAGDREYAAGPGERTQGGRRRCAGMQKVVGTERAGSGAGFDFADAADGGLSDGAGIPAQPGGENRIRQGSSADDAVRPAPGAVQRGPDAAVL